MVLQSVKHVKIGQCDLYCADALELVRDLAYDCFVTDPPNGWNFASTPEPVGPAVVSKLSGPGIVFPGIVQYGLYPAPDALGWVYPDEAKAQPVLF